MGLQRLWRKAVRFVPRLPPSIPSPETETVWERAKRDTARVRKTWHVRGAILLAEAVTLVTVEEVLVSATKPGIKVAVLTLLAIAVPVAVLVLIYAFQAWRAAYRQRTDWRAQITRERLEAEEKLRGQADASKPLMEELASLREQLAQTEKQRDRNEAETLRQVALLLRTEITSIRQRVENFTKDRLIPDDFAFPTNAWRQHADFIAQYPELYGIIESAYSAADRVTQVFDWRRSARRSRLIGATQNDGLIEAGAHASAAIAGINGLLSGGTTDDVQIAADTAYARDRDYLEGKIGAWGPVDAEALRLTLDSQLEQEELENGAVRVTLRSLVTNSEADRDVSLEFSLAISNNESGRRVFVAHPDQRESMPVRVKRMDDARLTLTFTVQPSVLSASYDIAKYRWFPKRCLRLNVFDRVSNQHLSLPLPASHRPER